MPGGRLCRRLRLRVTAADPFLIPVSGDYDLTVRYTGTGEGASAMLVVSYGGGQTLNVGLTGRLTAVPVGPAVRWLLPALLVVLGSVPLARRA